MMNKLLMLPGILLLVGCASLESKMLEFQMAMVAPWADDKPLVLDDCYGCFHLGPLQYDEMLLALRDVDRLAKDAL
tara:strand:+ start:973 stop:1200 length:228 start_codon:yes stop_codon:yes gene_type:complete